MFRSPREQASPCTYRIEDRSEMTSDFGVPSRDVRPALRPDPPVEERPVVSVTGQIPRVPFYELPATADRGRDSSSSSRSGWNEQIQVVPVEVRGRRSNPAIRAHLNQLRSRRSAAVRRSSGSRPWCGSGGPGRAPPATHTRAR